MRLIGLPGLLGERFFAAVRGFRKRRLDPGTENELDLYEFTEAFTVLYKGTYTDLMAFLFQIFDFADSAYLKPSYFTILKAYLPKTCVKCSHQIQFLSQWDVPHLFGERSIIRYSEFAGVMAEKPAIGSMLLTALLASIPAVLHQVFVSSTQQPLVSGPLSLSGSQKNYEVKNESLYGYVENQLVSIIPLTGMYLFPSPESFELKNAVHTYQFSFVQPERGEDWIQVLQNCVQTRDITQDYVLLDTIGRGAFGLVKQAIHKASGEKVAIKIISKEPLDALAESRLRLELQVLQLCTHPNLLKFRCLVESIDKFYIVTELVTGGSLFTWLEERQFSISEQAAKGIVRDIASALVYLHSLGIFHRDIKPENVLLEATPQGIRCKLIDFGLACFLGPDQFSSERAGTFKYAAPEVLAQKPYREAVDAWSLGVMTHLLLVGRLPFDGKTTQIVVNRIIQSNVSTMGAQWSRVSDAGKEVVRRLLHKAAPRRMKIHELLEHEWLNDIGEEGIVQSMVNRH